jgi:hypothetical protein
MSKLKIPEKITIDGEIEVVDSFISLDTNPYTDEIGDASIVIRLKVVSLIGGAEITFNSQISHKLTNEEKANLIKQFI